MTPLRGFLAGLLAAMTVAAVIHGDMLWLLFQTATGCLGLGAGMIIGRLRRLDEDAAYVRWLHSRPAMNEQELVTVPAAPLRVLLDYLELFEALDWTDEETEAYQALCRACPKLPVERGPTLPGLAGSTCSPSG